MTGMSYAFSMLFPLLVSIIHLANLSHWVLDYGLWGVFFVCLLGATILPIPTEASIALALSIHLDTFTVWWVASLGNCLGAHFNYILGAFFSKRFEKQLEKPSGQKAKEWLEKYGGWAMILSWAPFVGDPMCVVAGMIRLRWHWLAIGYISRIARYAIFIWMLQAVM